MFHFQRNLFIISSVFALLWLTLLCVSQEAKAQDRITASVESRRLIDVCGQTKDQVVVVLNLGNISRSDSLFGCNFKLNYDSTKLRFHSALYLNTLAEFFEFKQVGFFSNGSIVGAVANLSMNPVSGNRPLIGFLGDYLSKCPDSVEVSIDYIEFTDEFKKAVDNQNGYVQAEVADKPDRYFKLYIAEADTTVIDSLSSEVSLAIRVEQGIEEDITSMEMLMVLKDFNNFDIKNIEPADKSILDIESIENRDDSVLIKFFVNGKLNGKEIAIVEIAEKREGKEIAEIQIKPLVVNNHCACFSRLLSDEHFIVSQDRKDADTTDTTTVVVNDYMIDELVEEFYDAASNEWVVNIGNEGYAVSVYDLKGSEVLFMHGSVGVSRISLDRFSTGVYYGIIRVSNKIVKKKIFIKN